MASGAATLCCGCAATALSLLIHLAATSDLSRVDPSVSSRYLAAFVDAWDGHRRPAAIFSVGTILNVEALLVALIWLNAFAVDLPRPALFVLRAVIASAVLSLSVMFLSWLPASAVPPTLLTLMPSRFLNFNVLAFVPLMLGLLGAYRRSVWSQLVTAVLLYGSFASHRSMVWDAYQGPGWLARIIQFNPWHAFVAASIGLVGVRMTAAWNQARAVLATRAARAMSLALLAVSAVLTWRLPQPYPMLDLVRTIRCMQRFRLSGRTRRARRAARFTWSSCTPEGQCCWTVERSTHSPTPRRRVPRWNASSARCTKSISSILRRKPDARRRFLTV